MNNKINLDYYKIFYEVAKEGNITKAANNLFISQPAVTQTIKKLEDNLKTTLFIRNSKGMNLTKIGEKIFSLTEKGLKTFESIENLAKDEEELTSGEITISCGTNIAKKILLPSVVEFNSIYPNISIKIEDNVQAVSFQKLEKGEIDLLISQKNDINKNLKFSHLCYEKYVFVTKYSDELLNKVILMAEGTYSRQIFDNFIKGNTLQFKNSIIANGYNTAIELCKSGFGIMIAPYYLVEDLIKDKILKIVYKDKKVGDIQDFGFYTNENCLTKITNEFSKILIKNNK